MSRLPAEIETGDGRRLGLREVDPGDMLDLIEAAGSAAGSGAWMSYAMMICAVNAIDGKPVMMPTTKQAVRELGRKIGLTGMDALSLAHFAAAPDAAAVAEEKDSLKN